MASNAGPVSVGPQSPPSCQVPKARRETTKPLQPNLTCRTVFHPQPRRPQTLSHLPLLTPTSRVACGDEIGDERIRRVDRETQARAPCSQIEPNTTMRTGRQ